MLLRFLSLCATRRWRLGGGCFMLLAAVVVPSRAQGLPDGIPAGPWILAPYARFEYEADDNIFRRAETPENSNDPRVESDQLGTLWGGMLATLPIKNSVIDLSAELSKFAYRVQDFTRDTTRDIEAGFTFNFGSGDQMSFRDRYFEGLSQVQEADPGGEIGEFIFRGQPFDYNELEFDMSRALRGRIGYSLKLRRVDLEWEEAQDIFFLDYDGWENSAEIGKPIAGRKWITAALDWRRLDYFSTTPDDPKCAPPPGPCRKEEFESLLVGMRGFQSKGSPFYVRLGYGRFAYKLVESAEFKGLVGSAKLRIPVGGRSHLDMVVQRRPLPSNNNTYYISDEVRLHFIRRWLRDSDVGIDFLLGTNEYGDLQSFGNPVDNPDCQEFTRNDTRIRIEAYAQWSPYERMAFRLAAIRDDRASNCSLLEYDSNRLMASVSYGWY